MAGLLIAGTSHCGKSTLAARISHMLGWRAVSTDTLGRHPGRPWLNIPQTVAEFYDVLSDESIYWFYRVHHDNMWPLMVQTVATAQLSSGGFVLEGSALRPEKVAGLEGFHGEAICLTAPEEFLVARIRNESGYSGRTDAQRRHIDKFMVRSLRDNLELADAARRHDIAVLDVSDARAFEEATAQLARKLGSAGGPLR